MGWIPRHAFLVFSFGFYLWASVQFHGVFTFLFSLSYVCWYLPILPTSFEALPTSIPVLRLVWFRSAEFRFLLSLFSSFTVHIQYPVALNSEVSAPCRAVYLLPRRCVISLCAQGRDETSTVG